MNTTDLDQLVRLLADRLPDTAPAVAELEHGGRLLRRRRRALAGGVVVLLVALALSVVPVLDALTSHGDGDAAGRPQPMLVAAAGTRYVELGHVAVAVPDRFELNDARCPDLRQPDELFVYSSDAICPGGESETRTGVEIGRLSGPGGKYFHALPASGRAVDGHAITGPTHGTCLGNALTGSSCPEEQIFAIPDEDVYLVIIASQAETTAMIDSLRILPDGYPALPNHGATPAQ